MKCHVALSIIIFVIAGCSSSNGPALEPLSYIPNLQVTDSVDFGIVAHGTYKDTTIELENKGTDTLAISQRFSPGSFILLDSSQFEFSIPPGTKKSLKVRFTPAGSSIYSSIDTLRSGKNFFIIVLLGRAKPFSTMFPVAPSVFELNLTGLVGDGLGGQQDYNYDFSGAMNGWGDTLSFQNTYSWNDPAPHAMHSKGYSYQIWVQLDTTNRSIRWFKANYYQYEYNQGGASGHGVYEVFEELSGHGIPLGKDTLGWSTAVEGDTIAPIIDTAIYYSDQGGNLGGVGWDLAKIVGYENSASLSVHIW